MSRIALHASFAAIAAGITCVAMLASCTEDLGLGADSKDGAADAVTSADGASDAGASIDGTATNQGDSSSPTTDSATTIDADTGPPLEDGGCGIVIAQEGALIAIQVFADALPTPGGGTITPGTYALTAYRVHGGGPQGTGNTRETIVITGSPTVGAIKKLSELSDTTGDFTAHGPLGEHFTFTGSVGTPAIFEDEDCPQTNPDSAVEFTAAGDSLTLIDESTATERVYQKTN